MACTRTARRRSGAAWLLAGVALLVACGDRAESAVEREEGRFGGTVVIGYTAALQELNPLVAGEVYTIEANTFLLYTPLLRYTADLEYAPYLAERWDLLGDSGAVFHIRRDVRWHDGRATTAHDVAFTLARVLDPETAYPNGANFAGWRAVEALDSFTVRVLFEPGLDRLIGLPQLGIVPEHLLGAVASAELRNAEFNGAPVGNGPFRFVTQRPNDRTVFEANPVFPEELGGRPYVDRVVWRVVADPTALRAELRTGRVHFSPVNAETFFALDTVAGLRGLRHVSGTFRLIGWNGKRPPLDEPLVRRAFTMAIDRDEMIQLLQKGAGQPAVGPVLPGHWAFDESLEPLPHAPDSARALLAAAGFENRDRDPWLEGADGRELRIEVKVPAGVESSRNIAQMAQSDLADVGVRVDIRSVDGATFTQDFTSPERNFDAVVLGWQAGLDLNLRDVYHSDAIDGIFQLASYRNPSVDSLLDALETARSRNEATPLLHRIQTILRDEQPWSYLYYQPRLFVLSESLRGVEVDIRGALVTTTDWWLADEAFADLPGEEPEEPEPETDTDREDPARRSAS